MAMLFAVTSGVGYLMVLSGVAKILLDWKLNNFGVEGALFFGSAFGGALCGAVLGGVVMNRLYRWRQSRSPSPES